MTKSMNFARFGLIAIASTFVLAACGSNDSDMDEEPVPPTDGTAVWDYLQQENYQADWRLWPDKGELYEGSSPHGAYITTYLNDAAYDAVMNGNTPMPDGAIIVKENYTPDSTLNSITTMYKVQDYNPDHKDWFWLKNNPEGVIDVEGRVDGCQSCHQQVSDRDYLFTEFPE